MVVCAEVRDHAKRSVLRKLYLALGLWFPERPGVCRCCFHWAAACCFWPLMYKEVATLLQYQYGIYRGSGSGLSDRTCHEASGDNSRFFALTLREMRGVGLFLPFYFFYFFSWTVKWNPLPADQTEYYAVHFLCPCCCFALLVSMILSIGKAEDGCENLFRKQMK